MIRFLRKYQRGVLGILAVAFICLAMAGFGLDILGGQRNRPAISVNDIEISYEDFHQRTRDVREQYRRMFKGGNFDQIARSLGLNINQQVVDQLIDSALIDQQTEELGLSTGDEELRVQLRESFPDNSMYASYLRQVGLTGPQFENKMRRELARAQFGKVIDDLSHASKLEAERMVRDDETAYSVSYLSISPASFKSSVKPREDAELKKYCEDNITSFETAPKVAYEYVIFDPLKFTESVQLTDEDIALYLSEHEAQFMDPARAKVLQIQLLFPKEPDPEKMAAVKTRAEEALARAQADEPFDGLVNEYSDDITTKFTGGSLGWVTKGSLSKEIDRAIFDRAATGVPDLISSDTGFSIVKIEEFEEAKPKALTEVREEISKTIREAEAPVYAASKAQEVLVQIKKSETALKDLVEPLELSVAATAEPLEKNEDPGASLAGLTAKVLENPTEKTQLIELEKATVLVHVTNYQEPAVPAFDAVKQKVIDHFTEIDSRTAAKEAAGKILDEMKGGKSIADIAKDQKLSLKTEAAQKRSAAGTGDLADSKLREKLFTVQKAGAPADGVFETASGFTVAQVTAIEPPKAEDLTEKIDKFRESQNSSIRRELYQALIGKLKQEAKIDFDQSLLGS